MRRVSIERFYMTEFRDKRQGLVSTAMKVPVS